MSLILLAFIEAAENPELAFKALKSILKVIQKKNLKQ